MAGTVSGGKQAAKTNKQKYGEDFYARIGAIGAEKYRQKLDKGIAKPRGFAADRELAVRAGRLGGQISRKTKSSNIVSHKTDGMAYEDFDNDGN